MFEGAVIEPVLVMVSVLALGVAGTVVSRVKLRV